MQSAQTHFVTSFKDTRRISVAKASGCLLCTESVKE
nr:MAG TPA: hypothetical protein [Caudoviricetes sp.]